jgi:P-type E1-E2 ATPase
MITEEGEERYFTEQEIINLRQNWRECARRGERIIAVCTCDSWYRNISDYDNLTFVSLICIKDDLRKDAKTSVKTLQKAGIQTVMITGDNLETATAIAEECGILDANYFIKLFKKQYGMTPTQYRERVK